MTLSGERLLLTPRAQRWIDQFDPRDRGAAELLVRSLVLVSKDDLETTLVALIRHRRVEVRNDPLRPGEPESPIALFGIREIERYCEIAQAGARPRYNSAILTRGQVDSKHRTQEIGSTLLPFYFETCKRDARSNPVGSIKVGSEGDVAYLVRRLSRQTRREPSGSIAHPALDKLRQKNCRDLFLVDDLIGSGDRTIKFIPAFCRHPTITSWLSGGFLRISVIAFGATRWGLQRARKARPRVSTIRYEHDVLSGRHCWPEDRQAELIDLCQRYSERTGCPEMALGYRGTDVDPPGLCCMVFSYKCPNNAPAVLWAGNGARWMPLFNPIPSEGLLECFQGGGDDIRQSVLLVLLTAVRDQRRPSVEDINRQAGLGMSVCQRWLEWCEVNGLVEGVDDNRLRLTRAGRRELERAGQLVGAAPADTALAEHEPFYYPSKLRASQG